MILYSLSELTFSLVLSLIIGTITYFVFITEDNKNSLNSSIKKFHSFLNFESFIFEKVLKFIYVIAASFFTIYGLTILLIAPLRALFLLVICNILLRVIFEFLISIFRIKDTRCTLDDDMYFDDFYDDDYDYDDEFEDVDILNAAIEEKGEEIKTAPEKEHKASKEKEINQENANEEIKNEKAKNK